MLAIEVTFLTGRFVATAYNDRTRPEWPPHPARLFSALLATHSAAPRPSEVEREALEWLETLAPPHIAASSASEREAITVFVPVNDTTLWSKSGGETWHTTRAELDRIRGKLAAGVIDTKTEKALLGAEKKATKNLERLAARMRKELEPGKPSLSAQHTASQLLPDPFTSWRYNHRRDHNEKNKKWKRPRQPRSFPSVTPDEPRVVFVWPDAKPQDKHRDALDGLAARLVRLGHSSSLVSARLVHSAPMCNWRPDDAASKRLRVVSSGQCQGLEEAYNLHEELAPRVLPARSQRYADHISPEVPDKPHSVFDDHDWLILRRVQGPSLVSTSCVGLADALRRVLIQQAGDPVPEIISGHAGPGVPSERDHLAFVPLPFVGHHYADGRILGVALILPRDIDSSERRAIYQTLARWEESVRLEDEDSPRLPLHLGRTGILYLQRLEAYSRVSAALRPETWCRPTRRWVSVTPVALDRHPGDLHSRNVAKLSRSIQEAQDTLRAACRRIGLPPLDRVTILPNAPWSGALKARCFPRFPSSKDRNQRMLTHACLLFKEAVRGPILLGAGRYLGLGLFRPGEEGDDD